ncbi:MAG: hypothetical protein KBF53_11560 [Sphingobium sp.]|jgi:hypothetical protein|nr:hypothetical protein [Sphingobium sp.]
MHREDGLVRQLNLAGTAGSEASFGGEPPWTEDEILRLHGLLLEKSLHDLFDLRVSAATRTDIFQWLQAPRVESGAFTYRACCRLFGLDADEIRDQVLQRYRQRYTH